MGKNLKGKECGKGICQRKDGQYYARFVDRSGNAGMDILPHFPMRGIGWKMLAIRINTESRSHLLI